MARGELTPQDGFLQDPATTYPVVIDPELDLWFGFDTYVMKGYSNTHGGSTELQVGTYDGGAHAIFLGRVLALDEAPGREPLVFHGGRFRQLADRAPEV